LDPKSFSVIESWGNASDFDHHAPVSRVDVLGAVVERLGDNLRPEVLSVGNWD